MESVSVYSKILELMLWYYAVLDALEISDSMCGGYTEVIKVQLSEMLYIWSVSLGLW